MSKKISLYIGNRKFDVEVDDDFAKFLEQEIKEDFSIDGNNDAKTLLQAYVRQSHELYMKNQQIDKILQNIETL